MRPIGPLLAAVVVILMVWVGVGAVRWARQRSTAAQMMASAMLLLLGLTVPIIQPPQQRIEEAREDKGRKRAEPGGPPETPDSAGG